MVNTVCELEKHIRPYFSSSRAPESRPCRSAEDQGASAGRAIRELYYARDARVLTGAYE